LNRSIVLEALRQAGGFVGVALNTTVTIPLWVLIAGGSAIILLALTVVLLRGK
jgi:hypothetical protein